MAPALLPPVRWLMASCMLGRQHALSRDVVNYAIPA